MGSGWHPIYEMENKIPWFQTTNQKSCQDALTHHGYLVGGWATPMKNISQLGWFFPIYGKIKKFQTTNQLLLDIKTYPLETIAVRKHCRASVVRFYDQVEDFYDLCHKLNPNSLLNNPTNKTATCHNHGDRNGDSWRLIIQGAKFTLCGFGPCIVRRCNKQISKQICSNRFRPARIVISCQKSGTVWWVPEGKYPCQSCDQNPKWASIKW